MALIDWVRVARGALWVLGLSVVLAACSYASWWARAQGVSWRKAFGLPLFTVPFFVGLTLFSAGVAWAQERPWLRITWAVIGAWCLFEVVRALRMAASRTATIQKELDETH